MQIENSSPAFAQIPNSVQLNLKNSEGELYLIQVAWPLAWQSREGDGTKIPVFYILDGNAYFFSAVEAARRCSVLSDSIDAIVVGVGYPPTQFVYDSRRSFDLTPPSPQYTPPRDVDGNERSAAHGGATAFLDFLVKTVRSNLQSKVLPGVTFGEETLVGHSFGGLCALHAVFTKATPFQNFVAISPSIWWNNRFILSEQGQFLNSDIQSTKGDDVPRPKLLFGYGSYEQQPRRRSNWTEDEYQKNLDLAHEHGLGDNTDTMAATLQKSGRFVTVKVKVYEAEDHLSVAVCGINWGISSILDPERFS